MFGGAQKKDSAEEWHTIMQAMGGGKETKVERNTKAMLDEQKETNEHLRVMGDVRQVITEIPR